MMMILIKRKENGYEPFWILSTDKNEVYVELMGKRLRKTHNEKNIVRRNDWVFVLTFSGSMHDYVNSVREAVRVTHQQMPICFPKETTSSEAAPVPCCL